MLSRLSARLAGRAMLLRPFLRRMLPRGLHHVAGQVGRGVVRRLERRSIEAVDLPVPLLAAPVARRGVVLVNDALGPGGAERQITNLLRQLQKTDLPARLLTLRESERPDLLFFRQSSNVQAAMKIDAARDLLRARFGEPALRRFDRSLSWAPEDLRRDILRLTADFVQLTPMAVHGWQDAAGVAAAWAARAAGVPQILVHGRNLNPDRFSHARPFMSAAYRRLASDERILLLNNSAAGAADYAAWIGVSPSRFGVVRNGVDLGDLRSPDPASIVLRRRELGAPEDGAIVGGLFRFQEEKRPLLWLRAAARIAAERPDAVFVLFGDGTMRSAISTAARDLGLEGRLRTPGLTHNVALDISCCDLVMLASAQEGTPNVLLEAAALGVPTAAIAVGGVAECVAPGVTGTIVPDASDDAIAAERLAAAALELLSGPPPDRSAARRFVEQNFGMDRMCDELIALYAKSSGVAGDVERDVNRPSFPEPIGQRSQLMNHCAYPWQQMIIDLTGEVVPCCYWSGYGNSGKPLGNTNQQTIDEIWQGPAYADLRKRVFTGDLKDHPCGSCLAFKSSGVFPRFSWPAGFVNETGHCYIGQIDESFLKAAGQSDDPIILLEDGVEIGPADSLHEDIRKIGLGRYSVWGQNLYFSTSDNRSPFELARAYELVCGSLRSRLGSMDPDSVSGRNLAQAYADYSQGRVDGAAEPSMMSLISTADCNIDCPGCSQNVVRVTNVQHRPETVPAVLEKVPYLSQFIWHGGEPFLIKRFRSFLREFDPASNPNLTFGFTSNGTMIGQEEVDQLRKFPRMNASISIDSFDPSTFARIRAGATLERVWTNFERVQSICDAPKRVISVGMVVCKSNFLELPDNLSFAMAHDVGLNLSPVVVYPVVEQLDVFADFNRETAGWSEALDEAFARVAEGKRRGDNALRRVDPEGMLREMQTLLASMRALYADAEPIRCEIPDPSQSLRNMKRPAIVLLAHGKPYAYAMLRPGEEFAYLRVPRAIPRDAKIEISLVHDVMEPSGRVIPSLGCRRSDLTAKLHVPVPTFEPVVRPKNIRWANYGDATPQGLHVDDPEDIFLAYRRLYRHEAPDTRLRIRIV